MSTSNRERKKEGELEKEVTIINGGELKEDDDDFDFAYLRRGYREGKAIVIPSLGIEIRPPNYVGDRDHSEDDE